MTYRTWDGIKKRSGGKSSMRRARSLDALAVTLL